LFVAPAQSPPSVMLEKLEGHVWFSVNGQASVVFFCHAPPVHVKTASQTAQKLAPYSH